MSRTHKNTAPFEYYSPSVALLLLLPALAVTADSVPAYGQNQDSVALAYELNQKAGVLARDGRLDEAIAAARQGLEVTMAIRGRMHRDVAADMVTLASFYQAKGDYFNAEPLFLEAIEIDSALFGPNHPEVATDHVSMAMMYLAQGDVPRAEAKLKPAVKTLLYAIGDTTAEAHRRGQYMSTGAHGAASLGKILIDRREYDAAFRYFFQAEQLFEIVDQRQAISLLGEMAQYKSALGDYRSAQAFLDRARYLQEQ
jgi:tetratricopeptide (TPR) repeat protein